MLRAHHAQNLSCAFHIVERGMNSVFECWLVVCVCAKQNACAGPSSERTDVKGKERSTPSPFWDVLACACERPCFFGARAFRIRVTFDRVRERILSSTCGVSIYATALVHPPCPDSRSTIQDATFYINA